MGRDGGGGRGPLSPSHIPPPLAHPRYPLSYRSARSSFFGATPRCPGKLAFALRDQQIIGTARHGSCKQAAPMTVRSSQLQAALGLKGAEMSMPDPLFGPFVTSRRPVCCGRASVGRVAENRGGGEKKTSGCCRRDGKSVCATWATSFYQDKSLGDGVSQKKCTARMASSGTVLHSLDYKSVIVKFQFSE